MTDETITVTRAAWDDVLRRLAALEGRDGAPPGRTAEVEPTSVPAPAQGPVAAPRSPAIDRRRALLGLAGAAAAGVAGAASVASPAAAADGDVMRAGQQGLPTLSTSLRYVAADRQYGFGVIDNAQPGQSANPALWGHAAGISFAVGVLGFSTGPGTYGVQGRATEGVGVFAGSSSTSSPALIASNATGLAARFIGKTHLVLLPAAGVAPPDRAISASDPAVLAGEVVMTDDGLWVCIEGGRPGTWRKLAGVGSAGALHVLRAPVRVYDSRAGTAPAVGSKTPLAAGSTRVLDLKANASGVPAGATAALLTVLLVNATAGNGNATVWANGVAKPASNTMVWGGGAGRFTATVVSALDAQARIQVSASLKTDVVVDVVGYYR